MQLMKKDMGGAAVTLALAQVVMALALPVRLRLLIGAVENSVSGSSFRPGDVLRTRKGLTVEIGNTDAEGASCWPISSRRRIERPALLVDCATLTGAARVALGPDLPALFTPDDALAEDLLAAGRSAFEPLWRLPLHGPYRDMIDSPIADLNNAGKAGAAGAITAALFLERRRSPARCSRPFVTGLPPRGHGAWPTAGTSATSPRSGCGGSRTAWSPARRSGRPASGATRTSPAPRCSGGTTCTRGRLERHAAADVPGRRPQDPRPLRRAARAARRARRQARPVPAVQVLGAGADIASSAWIARATHARARHAQADAHALLPAAPRLQPAAARPRPRTIPRIKRSAEIDALAGELIEQAERDGARVIVVSEYGITPVRDAVHINRALREAGLIRCASSWGASCSTPAPRARSRSPTTRSPTSTCSTAQTRRRGEALLEAWTASSGCWTTRASASFGLDHPRSGELVAISRPDRWFSYYYWLDDARAPDFARTVDIHRKPGYDPVELFVDPAIRSRRLAIGWRLLKRKLGSRTLLDVISLKDTQLVKGSHGRLTDDPDHGPGLLGSKGARRRRAM